MAINGYTKSEYKRLAKNKFKLTRIEDDKFHVPYKYSDSASRNKNYAKKIVNGAIREF